MDPQKVGPGGLWTGIGPKAADDVEIPAPWIHARVRRERDEELGVADEDRFRGEDTDNTVGLPVEKEARAEDVFRPTELLAPQGVAHERHFRPARTVLLRSEAPAEERLDRKHPVELVGDPGGTNPPRGLPVQEKVHVVLFVGGEGFE